MSTPTERHQSLLDACPANSWLWETIQAMIRSEEASDRRASSYPVVQSFDGKEFNVDEWGLVGEERIKLLSNPPVEIEIEFAKNVIDALEFSKATDRPYWFKGLEVLTTLNAFRPRFGAGALCVASFQLGIKLQQNFSLDEDEPNFSLLLSRSLFESIQVRVGAPIAAK